MAAYRGHRRRIVAILPVPGAEATTLIGTDYLLVVVANLGATNRREANLEIYFSRANLRQASIPLELKAREVRNESLELSY